MIGHLRVFVHVAPDTMAGIFPNYIEAVGLNMGLDGERNVTGLISLPHLFDAN